MGTRSLTYVYDTNGTPLVCMYRQFDGYPAGHGVDLTQFLNSGKMVNGLPFGEEGVLFNGMGDLAAQMVAHFKEGPGGFYLYPTNNLAQDAWQEWEYHVYEKRVTVYEGTWEDGHVVFNGTWHEFSRYCGVQEQDVSAKGPTVVPFNNDDFDRDWLRSLLHESTVEVTFTKKDGTERVLKCTLNEDVVPPTGDKLHNVSRSDSAQPVYDIENNAWRSFRWDSVKSVAFGV